MSSTVCSQGHVLAEGFAFCPQCGERRAARDQIERRPQTDPVGGETQEPIRDAAEARIGLTHAAPPFNGHPADPTLAGNTQNAPNRSTKKPMLIGAGLIILVLLAGGIWYVTGPVADARDEKEAAAAEAAAEADVKAAQAACEEELADTYGDLTAIDSRLDVGIIEADYTSLVGQARVDFDRIDATVVGDSNCAGYEQLEEALTQYAAASDYWNNCIVGDYCTVSEVKLNRWWSKAEEALAAIDSVGIDALEGSES